MVKQKCRFDSYHNIPAITFFEIRDTGNYQLMRPKNGTKAKELELIFSQIYDDYFTKSDNENAKRYIELVNTSKFIEYKIAAIKMVLESIWLTPENIWFDPEIIAIRESQVIALNEYLEEPIDLEAVFTNEMERCLNVELGIMQNDQNEALMELEELKSNVSNTVFEFYDSLQSIDEINTQSSRSDLLLAEYVAKEKSAVKKVERQKQNKKAA